MIEIKIDNADLQEAVKSMSKYNSEVRRGVQREVAHTARAVKSMASVNLRESGAISTGRLRSSIRVIFTNDRMGAYVYTGVNYAANVEYGQAPGHWPNVGDLMRWVQSKITRDKKEVRSATYLIGRKIFSEGTEAKPFLYPAAEKQAPHFVRNIRKVLK